MFQELPHEVNSILHVHGSHGFSDAVHGQLRQSDIDGVDALLGADDGSDGASSDLVLTQHEVLEWHVMLPAYLLHDGGGERGGGVALLAVGLDDHAFVESGFVVGLVARREGGVHRVGHVLRVTPPLGSHAREDHASPARDALGARADRLDHVTQQSGTRAHERVGPHLLVVEEHHQTDVGLLRESRAAQESLQSAEAAAQVVQTAPRDELPSKTRDTRSVEVVQEQLEVQERRDRKGETLAEIQDQVVIMAMHDLLTPILTRILRRETDDRGKHRLLVDRDPTLCITVAKMNGQRRNDADTLVDLNQL